MDKKTLGFIGLGIMGRPMAKNLIRAGYTLYVRDIYSDAVRELAALGAIPAESPAAVARAADRIITMLPDGPDVEAVALGPGGIIEGAAPGHALIDMSSIAPTVTHRIEAALGRKGIRCLDAPVSGGEPGAVKGELVIMCGGPEDLFEEMRPVFDILGKSAVLVGDTGAGQTTKLVNQILVALHIEAMGEAFALAAKSGVDPNKVFEAVRGGLAGSNVLNAKVPLMLARNFAPGFKIRLHQKDLKNALEAAEASGLDLPVTAQVKTFVDELVASGHGDEDHGGIVQAVEWRNSIIIGG